MERATYKPIPNTAHGTEVELLDSCPCETWTKIRTEEGEKKWVMNHYLHRHSAAEQDAGRPKILRSSHYDPRQLNDNIFTDWRCFDEKAIETGDKLRIVDEDGRHLATGKVLWVKQTTFGYLNEEDKKGHMEFKNDDEMYETYRKYYQRSITADTPVKVLRIQIQKDG